jgi:Ring finger domain
MEDFIRNTITDLLHSFHAHPHTHDEQDHHEQDGEADASEEGDEHRVQIQFSIMPLLTGATAAAAVGGAPAFMGLPMPMLSQEVLAEAALDALYQTSLAEARDHVTPASDSCVASLQRFRFQVAPSALLSAAAVPASPVAAPAVVSRLLPLEACAVCLCQYEPQQLGIELPCEHVLHEECILPWLREHNTCPVCRWELPVENARLEAERQQRMRPRIRAQAERRKRKRKHQRESLAPAPVIHKTRRRGPTQPQPQPPTQIRRSARLQARSRLLHTPPAQSTARSTRSTCASPTRGARSARHSRRNNNTQ